MNEETFKIFTNRFAAKVLKRSKWYSGGEIVEIFNATLKELNKEKSIKNQTKLF